MTFGATHLLRSGRVVLTAAGPSGGSPVSSLIARRLNSTQTNSLHPRTPTSTSSTQVPPKETTDLPWRDYFALRRSRKNWERSGGVLGGLVGFVGGSYYFVAVADFDPTQQIMGLPDPTYLYIAGALAAAAGATVGGIILGGQGWRLAKSRQTLRALDIRDKDFFHRIQHHRPKEIAAVVPIPGSQSGMPDYYGEKILSVEDYRNWLQKQRKFRVAHSTKRRL
ncbi:mitochondrial import protein Pam17-domain-containing protein [Phlyctochytrium arcticum]|nr:mitochondrial import protein Pam17-domain-containing protein [Phlyctochytrium arcticum]